MPGHGFNFIDLLWFYLILASLLPVIQRRVLEFRRLSQMRLLEKHPARVCVLVPHYAMSGGTLIALAADEIILDRNAVLGPVDPQIGEYPAASILKAAEQPNPNRDDRTLILADIAVKALRQVREV